MAQLDATAKGQPARFHYAWIIVGVTFFALLVAAGVRSAPAVLIVPLEHEFGWSRATISFAIGLQLLIYGIIGPFAAGLAERFGLRATMLGALSLCSVSFLATIAVGSSWQLALVWGFGTGLGTGSAALVLAAIIANRWFAAQRGVAMGLMSTSAASGQLIFIPLLATLVAHAGWRTAVIVGAAATAAMLPLVFLMMRERPSDVGLPRYGEREIAPTPAATGNPFAATLGVLGDIVQTRDFWLLSGSFFACGATTFGLVGTHFIPACTDHGIAESTAADIVAGMGIFTIIGTLTAGWLSDRFDSRYLLAWFYAVRAVSLLLLPYAFDTTWAIIVFGMFYGFDWITTVPPTARLAAQLFGAERAGIAYGWIMAIHQVGAAVAAYGAGVWRTAAGDYTGAILVSCATCVVAAFLVLRIGAPAATAKPPALARA